MENLRIAFDAKRAFANTRGLGSYSRTLIRNLIRQYPDNEYFLYTPQGNDLAWLGDASQRVHIRHPQGGINQQFHSYWRSLGVNSDLSRDRIQIYHGLSAEIPLGLWRKKIQSVVTVHDLLFVTETDFFKWHDRFIYREKTRYACRNADIVIAVSNQTSKDLMERFNVPQEKLRVIHQSCAPEFLNRRNEEEKEAIRRKYALPARFILYVGAMEARKNLKVLLEAMKLIPVENRPYLVIAGEMSAYGQDIKRMAEFFGMKNHLAFPGYLPQEDLPLVMQAATAFVYPSVAEGFGIPLVEAMFSDVPVITANSWLFREVLGDAGLFCQKDSAFDFSIAMRKLWDDPSLCAAYVAKGQLQRKVYHPDTVTRKVMEVYQDLLS